MHVETWPIEKVTPYRRNPRKNDAAIDAVAASIQEFGFRQPIVVDEAGVVIAGDTRLKAARKLGLREIPVHVATGLSKAQITAYRLADNRTNENAKWDDDLLRLEFDDLRDLNFDLALTGFSERELMPDDGGDPRDEQVTDDQAAKLQAKWGTARGQLWVAGDHRILCGSCTDPDNWARLMQGQKAVLCNTDPPYGVSYTGAPGKGKKWEMIKGDEKREDNLLATLLVPSMRQMLAHTEPDAAFYVWHASSGRRDFDQALYTVGLEEKQYIVWVKDTFNLGHADYQWQHELCYYAQRAGATCRWYGDRAQSTVWRIRPPAPADLAASIANGIRISDGQGRGLYLGAAAPKGRKTRLVRLGDGESLTIAAEHTTDAWQIARDKNKDRLHPTQKPVRLFAVPILNHTQPGDLIIEPFAGAGGQFLAAQEGGRRCFGMDLDPKYVAVVLERLSKTGVVGVQEAP